MKQELDFSQRCSFCKKLAEHMSFHIHVKEVHMSGSDFIFVKAPTTSFLGHFFGTFLGPSDSMTF